MYVEQVRDDNIKGLSKDFKMNITNNEENALRDLLYDDSIDHYGVVIKQT